MSSRPLTFPDLWGGGAAPPAPAFGIFYLRNFVPELPGLSIGLLSDSFLTFEFQLICLQ